MVNLKLSNYWEISESMFLDYIREWEHMNEKMVPWACYIDSKTYEEMVSFWKECESPPADCDIVPNTIYFLVSDGVVLGCLNFRLKLNDNLRLVGGHIGYGIRPSHRNKGLATIMLKSFLESNYHNGIDSLLLTCNDNNIASIRTIEKNKGNLLDKIVVNGVTTRRYIIDTVCL